MSGTRKALGILLAVVAMCGTASIAAQKPATGHAVSGPFTNAELQRFRAIAPIDTHAHVFVADPFVSLLEKLNLHIVDILVVDDMSPSHRDLAKERDEALQVVHASHGYAVLCTSFDPYAWQQPDYARNAIRGLNDDFANGAIAVKLWKNVGMEIKDSAGHYLMPDNPVFEPVYRDIASHHKTLVAHVADPDSGWQPPNPASPDYEYYRDHPSAYMYGKKGVPSKQEILAARDHVLEENPELRVVGAHLGSMESDLADLGRHLDRYPNFEVDMAARMPYLEMRPRETVIAFLTKYQDRLIYGTDIEFYGGSADKMGWLESVYANDWRYLATGGTVEYKGRAVKGLNLPEPILRKIYHDNAVKWFPGILGGGAQ